MGTVTKETIKPEFYAGRQRQQSDVRTVAMAEPEMSTYWFTITSMAKQCTSTAGRRIVTPGKSPSSSRLIWNLRRANGRH